MKRLSLLLLLSLSLCGCNVSVSTTPGKVVAQPGTAEQQAEVVRVAQSIIDEMDRGKFESVWDRSSPILKDATFKAFFTGTLAATRGNLGKSKTRGATRVGFSRKFDPNAPEGEYSVVEVDSDIAGTVVTEKFVLVRESRQWKLAGYFINSTKRFGG